METENERDIEEVCLVESDFETDSEDFHTIDKLSQEGEDFDSARVIERKVHEPVCDENVVALSWYDSDLNLEIDEKTFSAACPLHWKGFCFLQGGVRATHGFTSGRVCFEVKITSLCNISYTDGHLNTHLLRVGWSPYGTSLALGSDHKSYGYDSNGRASTKGSTIKDYGKTFSAGDVIGAYVDLNQRPVTMSFTVNGEDQGIAFTVPRFELNNEALFPHILSKNIAFECNFGNKSTWFAPKRGYTFVGDMPLQERIPGPRAPKNQGDCEVIMMIGLPRSGKTTWALDYCARNPGKYYIIDLMHLIDKMELMDPSRKKTYLRKSQVQGKLFKIAATRCRNYILDQVNAMRYEWEWKMKLFKNFQRRAAVSVIPHEELERRIKNEPLSKGRAWLMVLKARIAIPRPSYLLSRIDYVGLPYKEARRLLKRYNREAWVQGYKPHKHFIVPRYLFKKKTIIKKKLQLVRKGRNPVDGPSKRGRSPLSRMKDSEMSSLKKEHAGAIAFRPERIGDEFSIEPFQGDSRNSSSGFEGDVDHPRRRQATPDLAQHRRWSPPARNHTNWPPGQTSSKRASSLSPPRNIASGTGYLPEYGGRQDFHKGTSKQDCRPPQNERHGGWRPPNKDYSPSRGAGGVQRQSQEFPERGMHAGPGFETKILDHDGPLGGRAELGFQVQNKPTSLSSNPRDSVPCHHPRGRASAQGDCYPPTRACSGGEGIMDRDCAQRQRRASDISPHGAGRCGEGHHRTDDHFGDRFASPEREGRFCEVPNTRDDGPLKERYRDGRSEFPSQERERRPGDNLSLQRDQRISRGDRGEIPLQERRMSSCQGRRDTCAYHENRMEGKTIQNRARASTSDSSICRERMVLGSGDRYLSEMLPEVLPQEGKFYGDGIHGLPRNESREHPVSAPLACDSRGVGVMSQHENRKQQLDFHPHVSSSVSPHREDRPDESWRPSEVGQFGGKRPVKPENSEWNRKRQQPDRELLDFAPQDGKWPRKEDARYLERGERHHEHKWGKHGSPIMDQHLDSKFPLNKEKRTPSGVLSHPMKIEHVGDGDITSYTGVSDVFSNRFEDDAKNPHGMVKNENWKGASSQFTGWQPSSEACGDWNRVSSNISHVEELPFQKRREENVNQPGHKSRSHSHELSSAHPPHSEPKGHSPHRRSRWGSRSPQQKGGKRCPGDDLRVSPGPEHQCFPSSRSPVHDLRRSPFHGPMRSPGRSSFHEYSDLPSRATRRSPDWGMRNSPNRDIRRSPGPRGWDHRESPERFGRGSSSHFREGLPDHHRRGSPNHHRGGTWRQYGSRPPNENLMGSPIRGSQEYPDHGMSDSPMEPFRESLNQDSWGPSGSPIRRSRSPDRNLRASPVGNRRGSPGPWNNSPSSMSRSRNRHRGTSRESVHKSSSPRDEWYSTSGRNRNKQQEIPRGFNPTCNAEVARPPFVHERLGPKLSDESVVIPYEGGPVDAGSWDPPGGDVRTSRSPCDSSCSSGGSCWERVPGHRDGNPNLDELAPYEQPFTQALWDNKDPHSDSFHGGHLDFPGSDKLPPEGNRGKNKDRRPDKQGRGNVWARVGGYVNDDDDPRAGLHRPQDIPSSRDSHSPHRNKSGSLRRGSRDHEGKFLRNSARRSPGRRDSPPGRSSRRESKRFAPYSERRRTPPRSAPRSHYKSPPRRGDWRGPPRRRGFRSPPRRW